MVHMSDCKLWSSSRRVADEEFILELNKSPHCWTRTKFARTNKEKLFEMNFQNELSEWTFYKNSKKNFIEVASMKLE